MLVKYLRNSNRVPRGVVVALSPSNFGYALCRKEDTFNHKLGLEIAKGRAMVYGMEDIDERVPQTLRPLMNELYIRAQKYYK